MFIDKKELGFADDSNFNRVKGVECTATLCIKPVGYDGKPIAGATTTPLSAAIMQKIKQALISHYKEDFENQLVNGEMHLI